MLFLGDVKVIVWVVVAIWVVGAAVIALCVRGKAEIRALGFIFLFINDCMNLKYVFTVITFFERRESDPPIGIRL